MRKALAVLMVLCVLFVCGCSASQEAPAPTSAPSATPLASFMPGGDYSGWAPLYNAFSARKIIGQQALTAAIEQKQSLSMASLVLVGGDIPLLCVAQAGVEDAGVRVPYVLGLMQYTDVVYTQPEDTHYIVTGNNAQNQMQRFEVWFDAQTNTGLLEVYINDVKREVISVCNNASYLASQYWNSEFAQTVEFLYTQAGDVYLGWNYESPTQPQELLYKTPLLAQKQGFAASLAFFAKLVGGALTTDGM